MDQQPKIPTLKDAQKPQVKIKGMGAGLTLFDRLKQFKKKDLAFILAGLGTLFMAPLAEHFMMAPENGDATLQKGWGGGSGGAGGGIFGSGSSPYENGNNNIASGGAIGGAGDIITPLNVRDPSALVMGPGAAQQPNAGSAAPAAPPPTAPARSETDYKDALAGAASRAASAAVKRAPLPVPKVALGGSGLRGLGVAGGGTSASGSLGPIGPAAGSTGGGGSSGLSLVRNAPGFRSAAGARSPTGGTGLDGTKKAGQNAGDAFSRTGSALSGLNAAASEQIPTGGQGYGGGGAGGAGANDKPYSGSGPGGSKSVGESLAFLEAKQRMEENLKLEFEKRKLKDPELLLYGIRNDSLKAMAAEMTKSLTKSVIGFMDPSSAANANAVISCPGGFQGMLSAAPMCSNDGKGGDAGGCVQKTNATPPGYVWKVGDKVSDCRVTGGKDDKPGSVAEQAPSTPGGPIAGGWPTGPGRDAAAALDSFCSRLDIAVTEIDKKDPGGSNSQFRTLKTMFNGAKGEVATIISGRDALYGTAASKACGATDTRSEGKSVYQLQAAITGSLTGDAEGKGGAIPDLAGLAGKTEGDAASAGTKIATARADLKKANDLLAAVEGSLAKGGTTNLGNPEFAKTQFKDEAPGAIKALKWLKGDGDPEGYIPKEKALLAKLEPVIQAGEFASTADPKNVPALIKLNKDYTTARDAAKDIKAGESKPATDVPAEQKAAADAVKADIDKANPLVPKIKETYDAYVAKRDATEKKQDEIDAAKKTAQDALDAATTQWAQAQGKQIKILNDAQTVLQGIKTGK